MALYEYLQNICRVNNSKLKIVHLNAQSLQDTSHAAEFIDIFSQCDIDIITVSETWLKDSIKINLPNYNSYYINRTNRNGGGVAIFIKSCYTAKVLSTSVGEFDKPEYILLEVLIGADKILLASIYRKPKAGYLDVFQEELYRYMSDYKYVFLCGDLNARFGSGSDETKIITDMLSMSNLHRVHYGPTYHTATCHSNLDVISSNCPELLIDYGQKPATGFSVHDLIYAVYDLSVPHNRKQSVSFRNFKNVVVENLLADIESSNWEEVYQAGDIDIKLKHFNDIIMKLMDKHALTCKY